MFGLPGLMEVPGPRTLDPAAALETQKKREILERLLDTLNEHERVALVLFELEDYSGEEIAELQNVPINTVWARVRRARIKLNHGLEKLETR